MHYAGAIGRSKKSRGAWPGTRRSTNCDANCGVGTQTPVMTPWQWMMDFVAVGAFATPFNDQSLINSPDSREANCV